jgi:hypothetical protein
VTTTTHATLDVEEERRLIQAVNGEETGYQLEDWAVKEDAGGKRTLTLKLVRPTGAQLGLPFADGQRVTVWPDDDGAGRAYAEAMRETEGDLQAEVGGVGGDAGEEEP